MVPREEMEREFGRRTVGAWQSLQTEAETSYATRIEGHFSVATYRPAVDYGDVVSQFSGEFLDVGCGRLPKPAYMNAARDISFFGIDPMGVHVDQPRDFPFARALGDFLPFREASFDGVMFSSSLDHCISPLGALEHARRVLRPGGVVLVWETIRPDDEKMRAWMASAMFEQSRYNERHNWGFTKPTLELVISKAGFTGGAWYPTSAATEWVYVAST